MQAEPNPKSFAKLHAVGYPAYAVSAYESESTSQSDQVITSVFDNFVNIEIFGGAKNKEASRLITVYPKALDDLITVLQYAQKQLNEKDNP